MSEPSLLIRSAVVTDLNHLLELEASSFEGDRLSRRSFRHFLHQTHNCFLVIEQEGRVLGYVLVLLHKGTHLARVYSLAVDVLVRGQGLARRLLLAAEKQCAANGRISMRLEVRKDNAAAIQLYQGQGYHAFGEYSDYYEDHADALRLQKRILHIDEQTTHLDVPYYAQQTEFTCGPAALIMAMAALRSGQEMSITEELRIWREATTIYMLAGHGGCSPLGLALAAIRRGFAARVYLSSSDTPFLDSVRGEKKKRIVTLVHADYLAQLEQQAGSEVRYENLTQAHLQTALEAGELPIVLISTYRFDGKKVPHWVVVTAMDERFIYIHDPFIDEPEYRFALDNQYLPVSRSDFDRMSQFGQSRLRAAVMVGS